MAFVCDVKFTHISRPCDAKKLFFKFSKCLLFVHLRDTLGDYLSAVIFRIFKV